MSRKYVLASVALALACLLVVVDTADAQRRGGRRGGGNWMSVGPVDIGWGGSGYGSGYGSGWGSPYGSNWYGGSGYYGSGWGSGYYGSGMYGGRYYDGYSYPGYSDSSYSFYPPINQQLPNDQSPQADNAQIRVIVPDPQARIFFDGAPTQQMGTERLYHTPSLQANANNSYRIRCVHMQNGRETTLERVVTVQPGRMTTVDFTQQTGEQLPPQSEKRPQPKDQPKDQVIEGKILRTVGQDQFVIQTQDNREVTVYTNPQTRYTLNNNAAAFTDLRAGNSVNVNYRLDGTRYMGNTITIRP